MTSIGEVVGSFSVCAMANKRIQQTGFALS